MSGVFTDNQSDFSWLMPYEEKLFIQYFLPYREVGMVKNASRDILLGLERENSNQLIVRVFATSIHPNVKLKLTNNQAVLLERTVTLSPEEVFEERVSIKETISENSLLLIVSTADGKELLRYQPSANKENPIPDAV